MDRKLFLTEVFLGLITVITSLPAQSPGRMNAPVQRLSRDHSAVTTAEKVFKNIQVLKGYPADQIYPIMQFINESLGISCEYCHITSAYERDEKKPKKVARRMMRIQMAINRNYFGGRRRVTCYSCHRGDLAVPQR